MGAIANIEEVNCTNYANTGLKFNNERIQGGMEVRSAMGRTSSEPEEIIAEQILSAVKRVESETE